VAQYLTFTLGAEQYGVDILAVQEIKAWSPITPIPNAVPSLRGVMNLRGTIVPVIDLRSVFGLPPSEPSPVRVIVVLSVAGKVTGAIVDTVSEVLAVEDDEVQPPPQLSVVGEAFVTGVVSSGERLVVLLDIERVLGGVVASLAA
jgi:purine-binding chemotaxis protein CheW